jgi:XTP/dITP diphosphohydrolase
MSEPAGHGVARAIGLSRVVLASGNAGKLREFAALLAPLGIELIPQAAVGVSGADEPHPSFVENALAKARHASLQTGLPALADDSGICVDALGGLPGVRSARWAALQGPVIGDVDLANNARLVADLTALERDAPTGAPGRRAHFHCVLVLVRHADDPQPLIAEGSWFGEVIDSPRGSGGFGYDSHFLVPDLGQTAAQLDLATKNRLSHRAKALRLLVERLVQAQAGQ